MQPSVFDHRRSLLQQYAKAHLETIFPAIGKYFAQLKSFVKPDARKSGKFCLLCFIEEIDKSQLVIVDTDSLSETQVIDHIAKIKNATAKSYGASWNTKKALKSMQKNIGLLN